MKQLPLFQLNGIRRRGVLDGAGDGATKSPSTFWLVLFHGLGCLISLVLGFRFSRLVFFLFFSPTSTLTNSPPLFSFSGQIAGTLTSSTPANQTASPGSKVVVGRHGILIRPWPHPNPEEVMRAHRILEIVQKEQRAQFGVQDPRRLIVVTPTYVRTFQTVHLTGVMHSLMNAPYDVVWIVVEAGGVTDETAALINKSGIRTIHIGYDQKMPITWVDRQKTEDLMRVQALRLIRDQKLDGIVMFADDSNMHSMELFDEVQKVNWIGALSVGIVLHSQADKLENENGSLPFLGPSCNSSENLVGWHMFDAKPYEGKSAVYVGDVGNVLPRKLEWAGFVLNSRLLWEDGVDKDEWIRDLDSLGDEGFESPLSLLKNPSVVEPLGKCGREVLLWWLRIEAPADSKFPPGWVIDTPLEMTIRAKHTPWQDSSEFPSNEKLITDEQKFGKQHTEKQSSKSR